ncbi:aminotransferase class V-fold PLP-dependent enzyme [Tsukamurella sp. 8F]|uniref:kynureninase n=1 Tax=Tsukamurella sp. 8F TaxID=3031961 RepID=UPI0023B906CB|nr:aminotransferase class V-fold PLP-dependent enzyme [Tsukamurella sp. 8F]MDF0586082.1 aminotransferase class V-fold PLP-dependent enzyme [Tsukamurella sp. 8F]
MTGSDALAELRSRAAELDAADPLAWCRAEFAGGVRAYLDGNSLGRPVRAAGPALADLVDGSWGTRLIRSWDEQWFEMPLVLGDRLGASVLGAAPGQTVVADSTTVMLYKLLRAAVGAAPRGRDVVVADRENFPTDRYVVDGVAAEAGLTVRWIDPDPAAGVTADDVAAALGPDVAVVLLSHVSYKSGFVADLAAVTELAHSHGALVLWDLCHSAGVLDVQLDAAGVDLAVGCTYKFLCGGPGAPAFGYVARRLQGAIVQPIPGWMGHADPFAMGLHYTPAAGMRRFISGTPPILGMVPLAEAIGLIERVGIVPIRDKSILLGRFVIDAADRLLAGRGVRVVSPRDDERRGGHVTLAHPGFREVVARLWELDVVPDFRNPDGIRLGLAPLSTSFAEALDAVATIAEVLP